MWSVYALAHGEVAIRESLLAVSVLANNSREYIAKPGDFVSWEVTWKNNLPVPVKNAFIELDISGEIVDYKSVKVDQGTYDGINKRAVWNGFSAPQLRLINPGQSGTVRVGATLLANPSVQKFTDKNFTATVSARINSSSVPEGFEGTDISGKDAITLKVSSRLAFQSRAYYFAGPITNTGPLPPKVGQETTYTIVWSLTNLSNDLENVVVRTGLPSYMRWKQVIHPAGETISYNPDTGDIVWQAGTLLAGAGFSRPAREVAFQVALVPGINLEGSAPALILGSIASGKDLFTSVNLQVQHEAVSTEIRYDPKANRTHYIVTR